MKKTLFLILSITMLTLSLAACSKTTEPESTETTTTPVTSETTEPTTIVDINEDTTYIPEGSDFVYADDSMTEIIGITEQCNSSFVLIFPETVDKISNVSITGNSQITTVMFLNDEVVLENVNFAGSNITTIQNLPSSMTSIPANMFYGCTSLTTLGDESGVITIPEFVTNIEPDAFGGCTKITTVDASNLTVIGDRAFEGCKNLNTITFSENLTSVGELAFYMCAFEYIVFPDTLENVGENAFTLNTNLVEVDIPETAIVATSAFDKCDNLTTEINYTESSETIENTEQTSDDVSEFNSEVGSSSSSVNSNNFEVKLDRELDYQIDCMNYNKKLTFDKLGLS
ncbi:MAG: leucine-rich repeat domain-containing protein [Bacilli bacterium]|nr:leucine-rich repeat domain-containing protein [Bacilli bacterium]